MRLKAIVGVNPWERTEPQAVVINCTVEFDGARAGTTDDISDTLDYRQLAKKIGELVESSQFQLIEALATAILNAIMGEARVIAATVEVDKPHAIKIADSTSVEVTARR
jgi:D-erythro-7,8-dihydroneopterin triphosphate epimerase